MILLVLLAACAVHLQFASAGPLVAKEPEPVSSHADPAAAHLATSGAAEGASAADLAAELGPVTLKPASQLVQLEAQGQQEIAKPKNTPGISAPNEGRSSQLELQLPLNKAAASQSEAAPPANTAVARGAAKESRGKTRPASQGRKNETLRAPEKDFLDDLMSPDDTLRHEARGASLPPRHPAQAPAKPRNRFQPLGSEQNKWELSAVASKDNAAGGEGPILGDQTSQKDAKHEGEEEEPHGLAKHEEKPQSAESMQPQLLLTSADSISVASQDTDGHKVSMDSSSKEAMTSQNAHMSIMRDLLQWAANTVGKSTHSQEKDPLHAEKKRRKKGETAPLMRTLAAEAKPLQKDKRGSKSTKGTKPRRRSRKENKEGGHILAGLPTDQYQRQQATPRASLSGARSAKQRTLQQLLASKAKSMGIAISNLTGRPRSKKVGAEEVLESTSVRPFPFVPGSAAEAPPRQSLHTLLVNAIQRSGKYKERSHKDARRGGVPGAVAGDLRSPAPLARSTAASASASRGAAEVITAARAAAVRIKGITVRPPRSKAAGTDKSVLTNSGDAKGEEELSSDNRPNVDEVLSDTPDLAHELRHLSQDSNAQSLQKLLKAEGTHTEREQSVPGEHGVETHGEDTKKRRGATTPAKHRTEERGCKGAVETVERLRGPPGGPGE
ncbi:hypothetical protein cyc_01594 [Cyclospora cayetanensis]|uniref:Uncharacterized protein n=1 Tax=Cyclospora cayetanensis TaxID=88456 RepID=A0A1D3D931_9EIME|nr:hypothetical protein cyc_01594 [Cyclospora cayetanensis]